MAETPRDSARAPLAGVRVLDLTRLLPGPLATQHLADYGADVIKIEDTGAGDYARGMGAMGGDTSYFYQVVNRNKRSLRLDLKHPDGKAVFEKLVAGADILVEGFRPGVMDKLGIGYAALARINPRLVFCSISGYGQTGPYAQRAGHDINYIGYAGVLDQIGTAGGAPAISNLQLGDLLGGTMTALFGVLVALVDARASGKGRLVDVSMTDGVMAHAIFPLTEVLARGRVRPRGEDLLTGQVPCYGVYRTADGRYMAVGALEEKFWNMVCDTLARPDLKPFHLATGEPGEKGRAEVAAIFAARTQAEWVAVFDGVDCCVTPVLTLDESLENPQLKARGMVTEVGGVRQFGPPVRLSGMPVAEVRPAPVAAGADSDAVLAEAGLDVAEIARLRQAGVI
ncbi:CaiB/BaiF CoA transferase family protein [Thauera linaloolentis]|uniref:L-carnitine dehydratase/bile acid-inducible protein F n=1 Tax=Thauera linaloolentis (strain DSM 12138 / JCM 21573 / CCUG 41526 / CIP 105981 / IAM 15112 / NBRC 102519 / 47Lol) TaxID=1123367 RepID=N6Z8I4_THAL4|nr:CaiB/BaiF CoA-transferase family protein [Thauera linaloolentis]ENO90673.1 L-carnitine dehydratase/bile acid-inducible protein F [Thauera linaloolentis 47Lol = DSM 12138]MCM8565581.1 CoA transferase [Thauera linaloolentis]